MTPEQRTWRTLKKAMGDRWHATRHEDLLSRGVPDVSYGADGVQGWLELKRIEHIPKRPETLLRVPHLTAEQRLFLRERGAAGGHCFLLLHVGSGPGQHWFLFDRRSPVILTDILATSGLSLEQLDEYCCFIWEGPLGTGGADELFDRLTSRSHEYES